MNNYSSKVNLFRQLALNTENSKVVPPLLRHRASHKFLIRLNLLNERSADATVTGWVQKILMATHAFSNIALRLNALILSVYHCTYNTRFQHCHILVRDN